MVGRWAPYVPVAQRRRQAASELTRLAKSGQGTSPVIIKGQAIATTPWGKAWCAHMEHYSDYANRLPRGRTYVRNGSEGGRLGRICAPGAGTASGFCQLCSACALVWPDVQSLWTGPGLWPPCR